MVEAGAAEGAVERVVIGVEMVRAVAKTEVRVVAEKAARVKEVGEKAALRTVGRKVVARLKVERAVEAKVGVRVASEGEMVEMAAARPAVVKRARVWALGVTSAVAREAVTGGVRSEAAT